MTLTVNNVNVVQGRITIPRWGVWYADVSLDEPTELKGSVTIKELDSSLVGTVVSGGVNAGRASYRIVGGAGGWRKEVPEKGYNNFAGCTFSSVARELATEVGETLESPPQTSLGAHYARQKGKAADLLSQHFPKAWHVGDDGVTRFTPRKGAKYADERSAIEPASELGVIRINADYGFTIRPGITVSDQLIGDVDLFYTSKRVVAYCTPESSSTDFIGQIVKRATANTRYHGMYEFRVTGTDSQFQLDLEPVDITLGLPTLAKVPQRSPTGYRGTPNSGDLVCVSFLDGSPGRPIVIGASESGANDSSSVILGVANSADYVALAGLTKTAISNAVKAIYDGLTVTPPVAQDGGAAVFSAFKTAMKSYVTDDVAATNVKAS